MKKKTPKETRRDGVSDLMPALSRQGISCCCLSPKKDRNQKEVRWIGIIKKSSHKSRAYGKRRRFRLGQTVCAAEASTSKGSQVPSSLGRQFIQMVREDLSHRVFSPLRVDDHLFSFQLIGSLFRAPPLAPHWAFTWRSRKSALHKNLDSFSIIYQGGGGGSDLLLQGKRSP